MEGQQTQQQCHQRTHQCRSQQNPLAEVPALIPEVAAVHPFDPGCHWGWPQDPATQCVVEPIQRDVSEWVADQRARRRQQTIASHQ